MQPLTCFKAYDVRGRVGVDLTCEIAARIGRAFAQVMGARVVVLGRDARASSPDLALAVAQGLIAAGADVIDLGLCGTEEVYFATSHFGADGGVMVTASHNPIGDNGMKLVGAGSVPLDPGTDMARIRDVAERRDFDPVPTAGRMRAGGADVRSAYVARVLSFADLRALRPLTILVNAGNGAAGPTFDAIAAALGAQGALLRFVRMHHDPDPAFPHGVPNPMLAENQGVTGQAVVAAQADFGVAWDGDFDRCFLFDDKGRFVPGEYVVGLLAKAFLARDKGAVIVHDPRVIWNTQDIVGKGGGRAVLARTGHNFQKRAMRDHDAVYGGEMSAHHYFRAFMSCDSGMIPWLMVAGLISEGGQSLAQILSDRILAFPSSGEINFKVASPGAVVARVRAVLEPEAEEGDDRDGLSLTFADWRMNLRASNTEALLRLNVEARGDAGLVRAGVARIRAIIQS